MADDTLISIGVGISTRRVEWCFCVYSISITNRIDEKNRHNLCTDTRRAYQEPKTGNKLMIQKNTLKRLSPAGLNLDGVSINHEISACSVFV